ncbi:unnamed protein product [Rhizoctonia solani]|uniref:Uncharacterized protein n=1 Tax=Rhizoctonia solani TaxID=456999 RepID=A0A8H3HMJ0_9AGAM|nr:unnamed protein product [Rhizoctonia solani]
MPQPPSKFKRARRNEHASRFFLETSHRHPYPRAEIEHPTTDFPAGFSDTEEPRHTTSASFDMLSVEPRPTSTRSERGTRTEHRSSSHAQNPESTEHASVTPIPSSHEAPIPAETHYTSPGDEMHLQLQGEPTSSIRRTTLILPATFALPSSSPTASSTRVTPLVTLPATGKRPSATSSSSASATASGAPKPHHPHLSGVVIAIMICVGVAILVISYFVLRRVRYKSLHVSRSQFQLASSNGHDGSAGVSGSESNKSFVSGGLGLLVPSHKQKNGHLDVGGESPLWGGREKFSPQLERVDNVVDFPPPAHLHPNERLPSTTRRRSVVDTIRRNVPGRLSKYGAGWNTIPESSGIPTFEITDMDTNHRRGTSGSTFPESPDPNLASIHIASVARPLSATASYSPLPLMSPSLENPRPAPKVPPKSLTCQVASNLQFPMPPVTMLPDISGSTKGQKKHMDVNNRGKIDVADISKPIPTMLPEPEMSTEGNRTASEADPIAMYAKYSAGLGVRNEPPGMIRRETSMAQKIAQIANSNTSSRPMLAPSQSFLAKRDTRALAAAAGLASPTPSEERAFSGVGKKQALGGVPHPPGTPGLVDVGNIMMRPFGQSGSMIPANLETPAIGLDGRASYLSTNVGSEAEWRNRAGSSTGPQGAITSAKANERHITLPRSTTAASDRGTIWSEYSQDFDSLPQQQNPDYRSPTYSIYNYYGPDRVSRMPSMVHIGRKEPEVGGAL